MNGAADIANVGSDATLRDVTGPISIANVSADLYIRDAYDSCVVDNIGGDLVLHIGFQPGKTYRFHAGGDIVTSIHEEVNTRFRIRAGGEVEFDDLEAEVIDKADYVEIVFGQGAALVELDAGGDVRLVGDTEDFSGDWVVEIQAQINEKLSGLDEMINSQVERAMRQAERAWRKAEREVERVVRKAARPPRRKGKRYAVYGDESDEPTVAPVTNEERMAILRMVENKQISVDEAEKLLAALEGRE